MGLTTWWLMLTNKPYPTVGYFYARTLAGVLWGERVTRCNRVCPKAVGHDGWYRPRLESLPRMGRANDSTGTDGISPAPPDYMFKRLYNFVAGFGNDPNKLAQAGHFLAGYGVAHTFGRWGAFAILVPWGLPKEFIMDVRPPENATYLDGLIDYSFYAAGVAAGLLSRAYIHIA